MHVRPPTLATASYASAPPVLRDTPLINAQRALGVARYSELARSASPLLSEPTWVTYEAVYGGTILGTKPTTAFGDNPIAIVGATEAARSAAYLLTQGTRADQGTPKLTVDWYVGQMSPNDVATFYTRELWSMFEPVEQMLGSSLRDALDPWEGQPPTRSPNEGVRLELNRLGELFRPNSKAIDRLVELNRDHLSAAEQAGVGAAFAKVVNDPVNQKMFDSMRGPIAAQQLRFVTQGVDHAQLRTSDGRSELVLHSADGQARSFTHVIDGTVPSLLKVATPEPVIDHTGVSVFDDAATRGWPEISPNRIQAILASAQHQASARATAVTPIQFTEQ